MNIKMDFAYNDSASNLLQCKNEFWIETDKPININNNIITCMHYK